MPGKTITVSGVGNWEWRERAWWGICQGCGDNTRIGIFQAVLRHEPLQDGEREVRLRICLPCLETTIGLPEDNR